MNVAEQLFDRAEGQYLLRRDSDGVVSPEDSKFLPRMEPSTDWTVSTTGQLAAGELDWLKTATPEALAGELAETGDPWTSMAAIAELLMHGDLERAKQTVRRVVEIDPDHRNMFAYFFGSEITEELLVEYR